MKFPQKSKLTSRRSVCTGKGGTACEPITALSVPLAALPLLPNAHAFTQTQKRKSKLVFPCGNGLPLGLSARSGATT